MRCRPESAPSSAAWLGTVSTVRRALRIISAGALADARLIDLASQLGVSARHLRRLFLKHLGASPQRYAATQRLHVALQLLRSSNASMTDIAISAGYKSIRRFNSSFKEVYGTSPSLWRRSNPSRRSGQSTPPLRLELAYRQPYDWSGTIRFLEKRALPSVERVDADSFSRSIQVDGHSGFVTITHRKSKRCLDVSIWLSAPAPILGLVELIRSVFDLEADPNLIISTVGRDTQLRQCLKGNPGLRVPGGWDLFELGVRAILGQQVTLKAAQTLAQRLVLAFGESSESPEANAAGCTHHFPTPVVIAEGDLSRLGIPRSRVRAVRTFAAYVAEHVDDPVANIGALDRALLSLPGIGPWTVQYIRMRALKDPDAFPSGDLGLVKAAQQLGIASSARELDKAAELWRPWRSYATMALWNSLFMNGGRK